MKVFIVKSEQILVLFLCFFIFGGIYYTYRQEQKTVMTMMPTDQKVIILDAGHGGWEPYKETILFTGLKFSHPVRDVLDALLFAGYYYE